MKYTKMQTIRLSKGITQEQAAKYIKKSRSYISLLETDSDCLSTISDEVYILLAKLYGCNPSDLKE